MIIKNTQDEVKIKEAARLSTQILEELSQELEPGNTPGDIDRKAWELTKQAGVAPSFYNVKGHGGIYGYSCCVSVNDEVLHGIPDDNYQFVEGDVVKIDFGLVKDGYYTDQCFTFGVGSLSAEDKKLVNISRMATETAMQKAVDGVRAGDLGFAMEGIARTAGFDTLKMFVGHGLGRSLHEPPEIPAFGPAGVGDKLKFGMVISVECQLIPADDEVYVDDDGWTIKTVNGGKGAMFEYMVMVGDREPEILTPMQDWEIII